MNWIKCSDRLPEDDYCYLLVTKVVSGGDLEHTTVDKSFFIKDREQARRTNKGYSRKQQGKHSVHFSACEGVIRSLLGVNYPYRIRSE